MTLEGLLDDAFLRGTGISRSSALKSPRYKELLASSPRVPNTTQAETAEMIYLGERLADRAFRNLPYAIRKRAEAWSTMTDVEQQATLNLLMKRLTADEWRRIHRQKCQTKHDDNEVLPQEYGSWSRGHGQPNCLGMTQMLIGFARKTGAEHLMVDTVTSCEQFLDQQAEKACRSLLEMLTPHAADPGIARTIRRVEIYRKRNLRVLTEIEKLQAHHALAIRVGREWVVVDPYLHRKYTVKALSSGRRDPYGRIMRFPRHRLMHVGGSKPYIDCAMSLEAVKAGLEFFARRDEPIRNFTFFEAAMPASMRLAWLAVSDVGIKEIPAAKVMWSHRQLITESLVTRNDLMIWKKGEMPAWVSENIRKRLILTEHSKRDRNRALARMVKELCTISMCVPYNASQLPKTEHHRIELAHPTMHLAVMTINHLGHMSHRPTRQLIRYSAGQWIIHDTLGEVMESGDARLARISHVSLRRIATNCTPHVMPSLLAEYNKRK